VRVGHLPAREHTRVAGLYPPANVPAGKKCYPYLHPAGTRGYRVYLFPQRHWTAAVGLGQRRGAVGAQVEVGVRASGGDRLTARRTGRRGSDGLVARWHVARRRGLGSCDREFGACVPPCRRSPASPPAVHVHSASRPDLDASSPLDSRELFLEEDSRERELRGRPGEGREDGRG
jgi:hypothetical protein